MKRWLGLVMLCFGVSVMGAEVTWEDAEVAVKGWSRDAGNTLEEDFEGKEVLGTSVFEDDDGNVIFYAVEFVGGGFVVTSTDDTLEPIVAFSATGSLVQDDRNPLWVMLHAEMSVRTKAAREKNEKAPRGMRAFAEGSFQANSQSRWRALMAAGKSGGVHASGLSSVSDVRVSPLVQSTWGQSNGIYNYYTPNQYVCGCVATAMAQVMRFHQYPTRSVSAKTRMCEVDGVSMSLTMKGGYYDWSNMPLSPGDSATTTQKQAIGKLTYDCGVSVYMDYTWYGSGAGGGMPAIAFETVFGYSNARGITVNGNLSATVRERAILANLDAGCPVLLGIEGNGGNGGHEVVGDGYGYNGSVCYVHLNMGWNGSDDAWYNLPTVDDHSYGFSIVDTVVYNIFPNRIGELLTGRVTDSSGNPLSGVMVSAGSASTLTNERGIYALYVNGGNTYTVTASKGSSSKSVSVSVSTSSNTVYSEPSFYTPGTGSVGNSWGNNFTLQPSAPANPPSAPTGVSATDGSSTANVGISWSSVSGATGYEVHRATSSGGTKTKLATVTGTSYTDTGATPGAVYYYWVKTLKGSESSGFSSSDTGYRKLSASTVTASTTDSAKVSVSCTAVTGATHYRLSRATSSSGSKSVIGSWQTGRTWSDTSAVVGTTYYYFVEAAVDASGTRPSAYSSGVQGKRVSSAPSAPTGVSATDGSSTANVGISWSSVSGATGYEVHRATSSGGTKTKLTTVTGTSYTDTGATPGAVYYYWVKTLKGSESSGFSSSDTGYRKLSAPTVTASTTDSAKVSVSCTSVTGATHYRLSRATSSSGSKSVIGSWQTGRTWSDTSAVVGTTYYYFVEAAVDASGTRPSAYSSGEQGKRIEEVPTTPPNAPSSVTATLGDSTANVSIHWGSVGGATGYEVYRATSSTGTKTKLATVTGTSYTDTSANAGTLYYYSVKATNAAGSSEWSIPNTGYRKLSAPTVTASTEDSTKVSVSCTSVTGATHYRLSRATSTSGSKSVIGEWQTDRTWSDTSATLGTTYYYYVEAAVDALGTRPSAYSISSTGKRPVEGPSSDPTIPSNVKATDGTATNHVLVSWSAVSGAESYDVYRSTTTSGSKTRIKAAETGTSYSDTTASAGTLYYYWVRANLSSGVGSFSDWDAGYKRLSITTVTASTNYVEKVLVSCTQVTGASYYRLSRSTSSSGTKTIIGDWQTSRSWEDTSGVVGTSYYYFVEAATSAEGLRPSDYSVPVMGARSTIEPEVAPNPPTHVKASDGISTNHVEITWSAPSGATSYEVYRSTTSSGSKTRIKKDVEIASYMDTTASAGTVYYYWVKANNAQGSSNFSDPDTGYKRLTTARVTASTTDLSNVIITCTSVTGAKAYRLSRATSITGTKTVIDTWQTGRSWTDTTASVDTDYYYFVEAAMDATGLRPSAYSEYAVGRRPSVAPPSAPTGLMASDGASTAHVSITWTVVSGATGYEVYRASSSSDEKTMIKTVSSASATDTSATPGFVYTYWVVATNKGGSSSYSSADTGYRKLTAPTVSAGTTAASAIEVSCTPVSGATHYRLARATSATGSKSALGPWQTGCTWSDASAEVDTTYYYFVEAAVSSSGLRSSGYGSYATGKRTREPQEFRIQSVEISPDGTTLSLSFVSETGKTYRVQRTDSLSPIAWTTVETITPTTTGSLTRTYSLPSNKDSGFYRVVRIE